MALFGVILRAILPDIFDPEQAVAIFSNLYLNPWLVGIVMAGIFSAVASTFGGQLLAISSSIAVDIVPSWHEYMMRKFGTGYQYIITVVVGLLLIIMASNMNSTVFNLILFFRCDPCRCVCASYDHSGIKPANNSNGIIVLHVRRTACCDIVETEWSGR